SGWSALNRRPPATGGCGCAATSWATMGWPRLSARSSSASPPCLTAFAAPRRPPHTRRPLAPLRTGGRLLGRAALLASSGAPPGAATGFGPYAGALGDAVGMFGRPARLCDCVATAPPTATAPVSRCSAAPLGSATRAARVPALRFPRRGARPPRSALRREL